MRFDVASVFSEASDMNNVYMNFHNHVHLGHLDLFIYEYSEESSYKFTYEYS